MEDSEWIPSIREADGLDDYQRQFHDAGVPPRTLQSLDREGAGFKRLMTACLTKERCLRNTEQETSSAMFYRARLQNDSALARQDLDT